jgi:hypothetical protein
MTIEILDELAQFQLKKMLNYAQKIYPGITGDDLWQPNDFPLLEADPLFRYEEGVHAGVLQAKAALLASKNL